MNQQTFLQMQAIQLREMLASAGDDPILAPQLKDRLQDVEAELQVVRRQKDLVLPKENVVLPRAAIFLRGGGVKDSEGIRPGLAGDALIQYERMFVEQAIHDERQAAREAGRQRRPRGTPRPSLLFTGTPRGSFGLEFAPQFSDDETRLAVHARSLENVADALEKFAKSDAAALDEAVKKVPSRVLQPMKQFLRTLAEHGAELRLAFADGASRTISTDEIRQAADWMEKDIKQEPVEIEATFRGVTRETGVFDLLLRDGSVISGTVADDLSEDDLERIDQLTNASCIAEMQKTTVRTVAGAWTPTFVLVNARPKTVAPIDNPKRAAE